jgi:UDP-N-acetylmuramoyl-tripeptide--D-alanyl-D-alanine ligase
MIPLFVCQIRNIVNGALIQGFDDLVIRNVVYNLKRMKKPNTLLFLKSNWSVDWDVIRSCVPCAVITEKYYTDLQSIDGCVIILVKNIQTAYWQFINFYRRIFQIPVVAVTGTSGKTTTKEMIIHILKSKYKVHGTNASANGRTGHLNNLMGIDKNTEAAVFETAVGKPGDITNSGKYFKPTIGIITNIGLDHLDDCKTIEGYIQAKGEMVSILDNDGVLILNADDERSKQIQLDNFKGRIVYFGIHNPSNYRASEVHYGEKGMNFLLTFDNLTYPIFVLGYGEHQVYNALAAFAAINEMDMEIEMKEVIERFQTFKNIIRHLEIVPGIGGSIIIDDTWKISHNSLDSAFKVLYEMGKEKKRIALLGSIPNLGDLHEIVYQDAGGIITRARVDILLSVGKTAGKMVGKMAKYAEQNGWSGKVYTLMQYDDAYFLLKKVLGKDCILLIKGDMEESMSHLVARLKVNILPKK